MKLRVIGVLASIMLVMAASALAEEPSPFKDKMDRLSYALGMNIGSNLGNDFKQRSLEINAESFLQGIKDGLSDGKKLLSDEELRETLTTFSQELAAKQAEAIKKLAEKNKREGDAFLAENGKKEGIVTLPSGLQYKVLAAGTGKNPAVTDTVTVNYRGTLLNGKEFDSSYKRGEPATFPVNGVIAGWIEALPLMKEGAKWQLFIPASLAYGEDGAGALIEPNSTLLFEVELLSIKEEATPAQPEETKAPTEEKK